MGKKMINYNYKEESHFHPKALYLPQQVKEYEGNPFLETLPPILSTESLYKSLAVYPHFNKEERLHPKELRCHYVMRLNSFFQPYGRQISLYNLFDRALRQGYLCRNPMNKEEKLLLREIYDNLQNGKVPVTNSEGVPGEGFMIIGTSGVGKSRSLSRLLSTYPQVIQHTEYGGQSFIRKQVLYLKIDCPHDGTLKGLIGAFFKKLDSVLGTQYTEKIFSTRATVSRLIVAMQSHIVQHGIGVLIVDEIQHLSIAKSQGEEVMLNFFVTLNNICKIPIIFIGTPKTEVLYKKALRQIRRMCGQGDLIWMHHRETDKEWELLLKGLWRYQWNREYTDLTPELNKVMFEYSQGIIAIAVKLFMLVQMETMKKKKENITSTIIKRVSENYLKSLQPVLKAMKTGKKSNMTRYEDIVLSTLDNTLESGLNEITNVVNVDYFLEKQEKMCNKNLTEDIDVKIIGKLQFMGIDYELAKVSVEKIIEEYGEKKSFKFLLQQSVALALSNGSEDNV
ncbi:MULTISPECIES: ATP-binding protein [Bacillus cereus group]|uniref:Tn7-like transposition protein C n=3 Tax=Bacillus cereus group TaxID=86661 RepID=A0A0J1I1Z8_BACAN|nr:MULTISPECIES: ATP-binding protein [Bacillus cereus group]KLV19883.1 Tn7-like transposition protein C [Bacillus anthracis]MDA1890666.1 ATP-binding protein [Bacillus cereus group sp. BY11-1LC]HDR4862182.1 ATP-binding protein [Bacillus cereus]